MTTQFAIILVIAIGVLLGVAAIREIPWRKLALRWIGPNPEKAIIYYRIGNIVFPKIKGQRDKDNLRKYHFMFEKRKMHVILPKSYPYEYSAETGRRIIGVQDNHPVASPLGFMDDAEMLKYRTETIDFNMAERQNVTNKALHSMEGKHIFNILTIVIVIGALIFAYVMIKNGVLGGKTVPSPVPVTSTTLPASVTTDLPITTIP